MKLTAECPYANPAAAARKRSNLPPASSRPCLAAELINYPMLFKLKAYRPRVQGRPGSSRRARMARAARVGDLCAALEDQGRQLRRPYPPGRAVMSYQAARALQQGLYQLPDHGCEDYQAACVHASQCSIHVRSRVIVRSWSLPITSTAPTSDATLS